MSCLQADLLTHLHEVFAQPPKGSAFVCGGSHDACVGAAMAADWLLADLRQCLLPGPCPARQ